MRIAVLSYSEPICTPLSPPRPYAFASTRANGPDMCIRWRKHPPPYRNRYMPWRETKSGIWQELRIVSGGLLDFGPTIGPLRRHLSFCPTPPSAQAARPMQLSVSDYRQKLYTIPQERMMRTRPQPKLVRRSLPPIFMEYPCRR